MMMNKIAAIVAMIFLLLFFTGPASPVLAKEGGEKPLVGKKEKVRILTPKGVAEIIAKIDTGTDLTSIDEELALSYGLRMHRRKIWVKSAQGRMYRNTVRLTYVLGGQKISSLATVADRSALTAKMLIGREDLQGFIIDPKGEFLTEAGKLMPLPAFTFWDRAANLLEGEGINIIPILGTLVVVLRSVVGLRTFGIFAPVVIALSLMGLDIIRGLLVYIYLFLTSMAVKKLILNRLQLLRIAEMALIIFTLVVSLAVLMVFYPGSPLSMPEIFFPLIVTTHIIERFTKTIEEYRIAGAIPLLLETFAVGIVLALLGNYLADQSLAVNWIVFFLSIVVVIAAGRYKGLRVSEFFRFKFLRKRP